MPNGVYNTHHFVSCTSCGQLTRIEFCYPLVNTSITSLARYCPACATPYEFDKNFPNGAGFMLVAHALLGDKNLAKDLADIYDLWDTTEYSSFKDFLRSLKE